MTSILDSLNESDVSETSDVSVDKPKLNLRDIVNAPKQESKFWKYEELPDKDECDSKKPRNKRIPQELRNLQDTEEYMEASQSVKGDVNTERSRRPPRRAAVIARENVNLLRGKEPTAAEFRENSSFEKRSEKSQPEAKNSLIDAIISINSSDDEEEDYPTPIERKISPTPPPVQSKPKPPPLKKAPSRESQIPKPPQLKRRPEPLPSPHKAKVLNMSPTISKLPDFKPKSRQMSNSEKPSQPPKKLMKEEKSRIASQENDSSEVKVKKTKKEKDVDQEDIAAIKKKNEQYEIAFKRVSELFYEWLENRAKVKATSA
ncbi:unnamed protein product [Oikopleura dioica]|uniref:Uncharacterized protein n=1 Tax=Oikopleura dioica TaxID=34765 RepID=E4WSF1_OIKDI|nr:unnamed protein product [Oikopleura dioica]CBY43722.1 unnamed protein product [Oikopleura dioica]